MTSVEETNQSQANILCKSCGLCCTGHLFIWSKLKASELDSAESLGLNVFRSVPSQRGFSQPCPLWQGVCTIYTSPHYPQFCRTYKCKLLKQLLDETTSLPDALAVIGQAKASIHELEMNLPVSPNPNFRERLVAQLEENSDEGFRLKARELLSLYENVFGVKDLFDESFEDEK
ncbi:MAG TPA: hypothetical protein VFQ23_13605 [Anaerolineales bacterium]|nr:hypothetical protein [Anaerolineales bacterium]